MTLLPGTPRVQIYPASDEATGYASAPTTSGGLLNVANYWWDVNTLQWTKATGGSLPGANVNVQNFPASFGASQVGAWTVAVNNLPAVQPVSESDGANVVLGATTDAAVISNATGTISSKLRGIVAILANVWDSVNGRLRVDGSGVIQPTHLTNIYGAVNSFSNDMLGRQIVSVSSSLGYTCNNYNNSPLQYQDWGTGTSTFLPNYSATEIATGAGTAGLYRYRQTLIHYRYQPGNAQEYMFTCIPGAMVTNLRRRWGAFDMLNGLYFEEDGAGKLNAVIRSNVTGSVVNTPFDITNAAPYGLTLDLTKNNIFYLIYTWFGSGEVEFGYYYNRVKIPLYVFNASNSINTP